MAYKSNLDKMLEAVLLNEKLMEFGNYEYSEIGDIYQALNSDNYVINTVAQIIHQSFEDDMKENEIWKQINNYLNENV